MSGSKGTSKRTNSLGIDSRAATDCFACQKLPIDTEARCDRQRPRCNICTNAGKVCSGYYQEIQWQGGASRAHWRTTRQLPEDAAQLYSRTSSRASQNTPTNLDSRSPRPPRGQRYHFVAEDVESDYVDKSFGDLYTQRHTRKRKRRPDEEETLWREESRPSVKSSNHESQECVRPSNKYNYEPAHHQGHPLPSTVETPYYPAVGPSASFKYASLPGHTSNPPWLNQPYAYYPQDTRRSFPEPLLQASSTRNQTRPSASQSRSAHTPNQHSFPDQHLLSPLFPTSTSPAELPAQSTPDSSGSRGHQTWHEIVGSPVANSRSSPRQPTWKSSDSQMIDLPKKAETDDSYDELLSRDEDSQSVDSEATSLTTLTSPVLQPAWHSLSSYDLQRIQHFDRFICPVPVTINSDSVVNPYREVLPYLHQIPALKHAILAIATQHHLKSLQPEEQTANHQLSIMHHKAQSVRFFANTLQDFSLARDTDGALVTCFILIFLDAAQTAKSNWRVHLQGVARILDERGGVPRLLESVILKAQMAMLVWYDMSIALVARKPCCIPQRYLEALAQNQDANWTFFSMAGCCEKLCLVVYQFCEASASGITLDKNYERVMDLERQVLACETSAPEEYVDSIPSNVNRKVDEEHDRMHGEHVWRYALLLYSARIFRQCRGTEMRVRSLARRVIDEARLIPMSNNGPSKQLLLPLLLAAADEESEFLRKFVVDYIDCWTKQLKFGVWNDAKQVLLSLWAAQAAAPESDISLVQHLAGADWMFG